MKKFLPWLAGLVVLFLIYLYASPYIALHSIKKAAEQGDADRLSGYIDFPSVKQSIKDQIKAALVEELVSNKEQDGFEALGTMLATAMIDPLIDGLVTPDGVALMVQGEKLDFDLNNDMPEDKPKANNEEVNYKARYLSFNRFKVQITDADDSEQSLDVIMRRDWLSWKVTTINFNMDSKDTQFDTGTAVSSIADLDWADEEAARDDYFDDLADVRERPDTDPSSLSNLNEVTSDTLNDNYNKGTGANAIKITGPLTPAQAARIDYLIGNDTEVPQNTIDLLNDFTLGGGTDEDLRQFIVERARYDDGYDGLKDCRNPDLTEAQYVNNCS